MPSSRFPYTPNSDSSSQITKSRRNLRNGLVARPGTPCLPCWFPLRMQHTMSMRDNRCAVVPSSHCLRPVALMMPAPTNRPQQHKKLLTSWRTVSGQLVSVTRTRRRALPQSRNRTGRQPTRWGFRRFGNHHSACVGPHVLDGLEHAIETAVDDLGWHVAGHGHSPTR